MTTWTYAGFYSDDVLYKTKGPVATTAITITTAASTPATLYADATKATPLGSNIVTTDADGNLAFFADPGTYTCTAVTGATFLAVVAVSPSEFTSDPAGFATTAALSSETSRAEGAEATLASAVSAETSRAEGAESTLTTNLASEVTNRTTAVSGAITTAESFATSAVGSEASRAETAEGLALQKASNLSDLGSAATGRTNLGVMAAFEVSPQDLGIIGWTGNPAKETTTNSFSPASYGGRLLTWLVRIPVAGTISNINYSVDVGGSGLSNCYLGLYSLAGSLLASCATDQSTNFTSAAAHAAALSSSYSASAGLLRVGLVIGATTGTSPALTACGAENAAGFTNMGISPAANYLSAYYGSPGAYTALPGSFTPSSLVANAGLPIFVLT